MDLQQGVDTQHIFCLVREMGTVVRYWHPLGLHRRCQGQRPNPWPLCAPSRRRNFNLLTVEHFKLSTRHSARYAAKNNQCYFGSRLDQKHPESQMDFQTELGHSFEQKPKGGI